MNYLEKKGLIQENMDSTDAFIKNLYTDLHVRIQEYEKDSSWIKKMTWANASGSLLIVTVITIFLVAVII